jgi:Ca2+-transporting ATPase
MQSYIFDTVAGVIKARGQAGLIASLMLVWTTFQCFSTLISATDRAWGSAVSNWWRLPLKSGVLLGITTTIVVLGMAVPVLIKMAMHFFTKGDFHSWVYVLGSLFVPLLVVFVSLSLFYRLAPRRRTRFADVWIAALLATALLRAADSLFVVYLQHFARLNAVYGAFGGIMALLLWIYFSGCIFIFGACLCAAQVEERSASGENELRGRTGANGEKEQNG